MAKSKNLAINCTGIEMIPLPKLKPFQGGFKELRPEEKAKLKLEMRELGMLEPITCWKDEDGKVWIMNGHQRVSLLREMVKAEEIEIADPGLPVQYVQAKDAGHAASIVLALASTYGRINKRGFEKFKEKNGLEDEYIQDRFSFPELDNLDDGDEKKEVSFEASKKKKETKCPNCGNIFDPKPFMLGKKTKGNDGAAALGEAASLEDSLERSGEHQDD